MGVTSVVVPDDDGDDVVEAALLAAVGAGGPAQATVMAASTVAKSDAVHGAPLLLPGDRGHYLRRHCRAALHGVHHRRAGPLQAGRLHAVSHQRTVHYGGPSLELHVHARRARI